MLQAFTWQQFLVAALIFSLVWLLVVLLLFYRKEVFAFLSGNKPDVEPLKHAWQDDFEQADENLMGKAAEPDGVSVLGQHDFGFAPKVEKLPEESTVSPEVLQSDLFDLMEDVKPLVDAEELDKDGLIHEVNAAVNRYPRLQASSLLETFYLMVAEQVAESPTHDFSVTAKELRAAL